MNKYVAGFAFDRKENAVVLLLKARPDWQKGLFNGVGGHIETNEIPIDGMNREWMEETGADEVNWILFAKITGSNFEVFFFRGNTDIASIKSFSEGEEIEIVDVEDLPRNVVSNLRWLIPMARTTSQHDWPYEILEKALIK